MQVELEGRLSKVINIMPEQAVRELIEIWKAFDVGGDPGWPVRSMKKLLLGYLRVLSQSYKSMSIEERHTVCLRFFIASQQFTTGFP